LRNFGKASMNCPKCNSTNVVVAGQMTWCQECLHAFQPSEAVSAAPASAPKISAPAPPLAKCPVCSHQVSSQAVSCPSCGQPLRAAPSPSPAGTDGVSTVAKVVKSLLWTAIIYFVLYLLIKTVGFAAMDAYVHSGTK
jgi:hypothetical protein